MNPNLLPADARLSAFGRLFILLLATLVSPCASRAQGDTEIFLASLRQVGDTFSFGPAENLSQNPGYDNQPSFIPGKDILLYSRSRNGQTDIARLDLASRTHTWLSDTPRGGEYSPLPIPGRQSVSAIRLDTTGLQRLYEYREGIPQLLFTELKVGYQIWAGPDLLICTVLREEGMDLVRAIPSSQSAVTLQEGVGRSLHNVPNSKLISYTSATEGALRVHTLDLDTGGDTVLTFLPEGVQDLCWLPDGSLLCGGDGVLRRLRPGQDSDWQVVHRFEAGFGQISRLAVNEAGTLLTLVVEQNLKP